MVQSGDKHFICVAFTLNGEGINDTHYALRLLLMLLKHLSNEVDIIKHVLVLSILVDLYAVYLVKIMILELDNVHFIAV